MSTAPPLPRTLPCPVCAALVMDDAGHIEQHVTWHEQTRTLGPKTGGYRYGWQLRDGFAEMRRAVALVATGGDDAPTQKFPPISETTRRRPPAPEVRELRGSELLRALADELDREDLDDEDLQL
jgi:hypothetical protein